jgi:hypothetical protein
MAKVTKSDVHAYAFEANDGTQLGEVQVGGDGLLQVFIDLDYFTLDQFKETVSALNGILDGVRNANV